MVDDTQRIRRFYDSAADGYDNSIALAERWLFGDGRRWVCAQARGEVLEIAPGTGRNFSYYTPNAQITAVELSPAMLAIARQRAAELHLNVDLRLGDAQSLDFADERFDAVVTTLSLCSIPDDRRAVAEAHRVLRPGGQLLFMEHVRSPNPMVRFIEWLLDPLSTRFEGDHLMRDPMDYLEGLGFTVEQCLRSKWGIVERVAARRKA